MKKTMTKALMAMLRVALCSMLLFALSGTARAWEHFPSHDGDDHGSHSWLPSPWNVPDPDGGGGKGGDPAVPEIDPSMATGGVALAAGSVLLLLERRRRR
jgi:hypothetical protein